MLPCAARFVLVPLVFGALAALPAAQSPQQQQPPVSAGEPAIRPPAPDLNLTGTWQFDDDAIREDPRNWRRPVNSRPAVPAAGGGAPPDRSGGSSGDPLGGGGGAPIRGGGGAPRSAGSLGEPWDTEVRRALRDLLEVTQRFTIKVEPTQVTMTDDINRTFIFNTDGREGRFRSGGTGFKAKTIWDGNVLKQEIQSNQFKMSQAFMLASDQDAMFVWLTVDKPELVPPIKKLTRVYVRVK